jgi:hypothetical protein
MTSSLFFCGACAGGSPELNADEKLAQIPLFPEFCDVGAGGAGALDGMSEELLPPMLVRDVMPPDVAEQPAKAVQNNNKRTARNIVTPTYMHTMPNYCYNSLNSALQEAD